MRNILFIIGMLIMVLVPLMAQATPVSDQTANQYYTNCSKQNDPRMSNKSLDSMCACNAAMMKKNFTMEDMQLMVAQTPESRIALNKMLINVYAPCMNFPVNDLLYNNCKNERKLQIFGSMFDVDSFCSCVSKNTSDWLTTEGRALMSDIIKNDPNIFDPIGPVMEHPKFLAEAKRNQKICTRAK